MLFCWLASELCINQSEPISETWYVDPGARGFPGYSQQPAKSGFLSASSIWDEPRNQSEPDNFDPSHLLITPSTFGTKLTNQFNFKLTNFNAARYAVEVLLVSCDSEVWQRSDTVSTQTEDT